MQDNNINKIISNALQVNKDIISKNIKPIITQIKKNPLYKQIVLIKRIIMVL